MKQGKFSEARIIAIIKEAESGVKVSEILRKYGISDTTYYKWKSKYAGLTVSELQRLKGLESENSRLKKIVAEQALDISALKYINEKNF
jgi:putative transposase